MKTELATYVNMAKRASQLGNKGSEKNWRWRESQEKKSQDISNLKCDFPRDRKGVLSHHTHMPSQIERIIRPQTPSWASHVCVCASILGRVYPRPRPPIFCPRSRW